MDVEVQNDEILAILNMIMNNCVIFLSMVLLILVRRRRQRLYRLRRRQRRTYSIVRKIPKQLEHLNDIISINDQTCIDYLRMSRNAFACLCHMLEYSGGLNGSRHVSTSEQLAMFLSILAHHDKIRTIKGDYKRSGRTVSKYFHGVLNAILKVHPLLLAKPEPVSEECTNERWKFFKGCLGALDGTCIPVKVLKSDRGRFCNRKGEISVNVLGVCNRDMNFTYVLSGWEGSAADSRVLCDAVTRNNGLHVPRGNYYLCDNGYTNGDGFLTPYRGIRYHLNEWGHGTSAPQNKEEFFNLKHSKARNAIERTFGLLKMRWAILRSHSFYPIKVHNRIIMACCLVHNFIRTHMPIDPLEQELDQYMEEHGGDIDDYVQSVECSQQWTSWRDNLASTMYNEWRGAA